MMCIENQNLSIINTFMQHWKLENINQNDEEYNNKINKIKQHIDNKE